MFSKPFSYLHYGDSISGFTIVQGLYYLSILLAPIYDFSLIVQDYLLQTHTNIIKQGYYYSQTFTSKESLLPLNLYYH